MKTIFRFRTLFHIFACLFLFTACSDDTLPATDTPETEQPEASPDALHDKLREKPYPKADNELYINPTPFIIPQAMKTGDKLQIAFSQSKDFPDTETTLSTPKQWCMHNPHQILKSGIWYWRFRSVSNDGAEQAWSETYSFEVKDETPKFVTPTFETFIKNTPHTHPRLYCFLDNEIEQARRNVTSHPEYKQLTHRASTALKTDYSLLPNPYDEAASIKNSVQYLYQAYHLIQDRKYANKLHEILNILLAHPVSDSQLFASNFDSTDIAINFIEIYDLLYSELTPEEKLGIEELLMRVLRYYFKSNCGRQENHIFDNHFWQHNMRVFFQACFILYDKTAYADEVLPMLEYYYEIWTARAPASGFNRDGVWHNGAGYITANIKTLFYIPSLFSYITRSDFLKHPWYLNAGKALVYTHSPHAKSVGFGDGSEKSDGANRVLAAFADFLAKENADSYAGWYADQTKDLVQQDYEFRLYRMIHNQSYSAELPSNIPKFIWYKDAGEVAIHTDLMHPEQDMAIGFRSSIFASGSHTLANQNSFNLVYKGVDVYRSSGYYQHFSDAHNLMSYRHTRAHNTILVNGIGQPYSLKGYGNITRAMGGDHISYCLGDASHAYNGISEDPMWINAFAALGITQTPENGFGKTPLTKYLRHLLVLHPHTIVIYDELEASEAVRWDWLLHSPTPFNIEKHTTTTENSSKEFKTTVRQFSNSSFEFSQTDLFVVPPATPAPNQWHLTATYTSSAQNRILTIIQITPNSEQVPAIVRTGDTFQCDDWNIQATMSASQPAELIVTNRTNSTVFSYSSVNPIIEGSEYLRKSPRSSLLYDKSNGRYGVREQTDYIPASTRAISY
ncbi:DUF4962 domain-containing protein [Bacteroides sp.]|uniref:DUF4962 domain-containing protein n=1 Tax=Bacteroides sp. TaxID=29523 RepID=UPI0040283B33